MGVIKGALKGGCLLGAIGFAGGFFGPIVFMPDSNQGPLFGIFISGPLGFVAGLVIGGALAWVRKT